MKQRLDDWWADYQRKTWENATPAERAAAYSGWRATFRLMWHRWTGQMRKDQ